MKQPLRVLHVSPYFHPAHIYGGPVNAALNICLTTAKLGHTVRVLTTNANGQSGTLDVETTRDVDLADRLRVRYFRRFGRHSAAPSLLPSLAVSVAAADVVHLTAVYSFTTLPTLLCCKMFNRPLVWAPHGSLQRWAGSTRVPAKAVWERACRTVAPARVCLHVTSQEEARESTTRMPWLRARVIPNGVSVPMPPPRVAANGTLRLAYVGRLDPIKAIDRLLAACELLRRERDTSWTLAVAGTGRPEYVRGLASQVEQAGLSEHVRFIGGVTEAGRQELLANADVLVLPSHVENFGMVVVEALAQGVPVIVSRGTPWSRVEEIGCGLWVDNTAESLADAIRRIRRLPLRTMGQSGRSWMEREFSWPTVTAQLIDLYREVMAGGKQPS